LTVVKKQWTLPGSHFGGDPEFYSCWTLFDLSLDSEIGKANLEKLVGIVVERCQPILSGVEMLEGTNISKSLFGKTYKGVHNVWCYKWLLDKKGAMNEMVLINETKKLKMIPGGHASAKLDSNIVTSGKDANTFFIKHNSL
jgi:hypothetical protein